VMRLALFFLSIFATETALSLHKDKHGLRLIPQPSSDPSDPLNFPQWLKIVILLQVSFIAGLGPLNHAMINPGQYLPMASPKSPVWTDFAVFQPMSLSLPTSTRRRSLLGQKSAVVRMLLLTLTCLSYQTTIAASFIILNVHYTVLIEFHIDRVCWHRLLPLGSSSQHIWTTPCPAHHNAARCSFFLRVRQSTNLVSAYWYTSRNK
jgi:hypothetical protein